MTDLDQNGTNFLPPTPFVSSLQIFMLTKVLSVSSRGEFYLIRGETPSLRA